MEVFRKINADWFLSEPLLFAALCTHRLVANPRLSIPMRTGKMRIEYNPALIEPMPYEQVVTMLRVEIIRVLLKHPYARQPFHPLPEALSLASSVTIAENHEMDLGVPNAALFHLPENLAYEEYYKQFLTLFQSLPSCCSSPGGHGHCSTSGACSPEEEAFWSEERNGNGGASPEELLRNAREAASKHSELWGEDDLAVHSINHLIEVAKQNRSWGTLAGDIVDMIVATLLVKLEYRRVLNGFRASVLSSARSRTRMRPSRRYGFEYMGSRFEFTTRLLVAVDVSGSVENEELWDFFSVINRFFKYGIQQIDAIQFDAELQGEPLSLRKAQRAFKVLGRGGTDFQPVFDYLCTHSSYDGLILFTDGYAPAPVLRARVRTKILWILNSKDSYESHRSWIEGISKSSAIWID